MSAVVRRTFNYETGATLAGFIATISLAAVIILATVGTDPTVMIASIENAKI
jgi:hypothetical protein